MPRLIDFGLEIGWLSNSSRLYHVFYQDQDLSDIVVKNKVGYEASVFFRLKAANLFVQPMLSLSQTRESIQFSIPQDKDVLQRVELDLATNALNFSFLAGYNIIYEQQHLFNLYAGPNIEYVFSTQYKSPSALIFETHIHTSSIQGIVGISASSNRLLLDFRYRFGFSKKEMNLSKELGAPDYLTDVKFKKRDNIVSVSVGFLF
ncbi:hypothetical protein AwDysgo_14010 [Bacteroidales bacterium]|nr:hypothetical protein AwDysgo_14010 [Bacteroidales bacterium]